MRDLVLRPGFELRTRSLEAYHQGSPCSCSFKSWHYTLPPGPFLVDLPIPGAPPVPVQSTLLSLSSTERIPWDSDWYGCSQSCPTLCNPVDCSPPGSSVRRISQARILDWVAISSSSGSSRARDRTCIFCAPCIGWWILYHWHCLESPILPPPKLSHSPKYSSNLGFSIWLCSCLCTYLFKCEFLKGI